MTLAEYWMERVQKQVGNRRAYRRTHPKSKEYHVLHVREMLKGYPVRLRYTSRYSTCRINQKETVAEHMYFVSLYAMLIGQWYDEGLEGEVPDPQKPKVNWYALMARSVIHDMEESRTGDWPRGFKHSDPELKAVLHRVAKDAMEKILMRLVNGYWAKWLLESWEFAKDGTVEGRIIAFADFLSVLSYIIQEKESGNAKADEHLDDLEGYFADFQEPAFDFLRPLVNETAIILQEYTDGCRTAK